ncbi:hypothetical protein [Robertmurraya massiliosenegalensis]|uniref:hypothetical protein n=1 Tax=Robertmurraya massiliosenegalensis TaxID=1287657 RepID=UPI0002EC334C|nr:hypothetical protein [Robertmurraya massiliosenegalensis]
MNMQVVGLIILVVVGGYFLYSLFTSKKDNKKNKKGDKSSKAKKAKKETVQELFEYKEISDKGITQLNDGTFTAILELSEINQRLNNANENTSIWRKFRSLINALSIRNTLLVQSQYLDMTDFINNYEEESEKLDNLTKEFSEAREEVLDNYREFAEVKTREVRCYAIFRFNPYKEGLEKGLDTGNSVLNSLINKTRQKATSMSEEEAQDLANSILEEVTDLAYQLFHGMGIRATRLNRTGVLNMVYMTLNRDLTLAQRLDDAARASSFSEFKFSETPFLVEELAEYESLKMQGFNVIHMTTENPETIINDDLNFNDFEHVKQNPLEQEKELAEVTN